MAKSGFEREIFADTLSVPKLPSTLKPKPFPSKLFSLKLKETLEPLLPTPTPAPISPVGDSTILISISTLSLLITFFCLIFTSLKKPVVLSLSIEFEIFNLVKRSPSAKSRLLRKTFSSVRSFPFIIIFLI